MLPRPSRLKSLASEFSPVLTTPPPVEPNTVLVLMSVPEMMLSSNLVALRRRPATNAAIPARIASAPATIAHAGMLASKSLKNPGGSLTGALVCTGGTGGVLVSAAFDSAAGASAAFVSGALAGSAAFIGSVAFPGSTAWPVAGAAATGGGGATTAASFPGSGALPLDASACDCTCANDSFLISIV